MAKPDKSHVASCSLGTTTKASFTWSLDDTSLEWLSIAWLCLAMLSFIALRQGTTQGCPTTRAWLVAACHQPGSRHSCCPPATSPPRRWAVAKALGPPRASSTPAAPPAAAALAVRCRPRCPRSRSGTRPRPSSAPPGSSRPPPPRCAARRRPPPSTPGRHRHTNTSGNLRALARFHLFIALGQPPGAKIQPFCTVLEPPVSSTKSTSPHPSNLKQESSGRYCRWWTERWRRAARCYHLNSNLHFLVRYMHKTPKVTDVHRIFTLRNEI